MAKIKKPKSPVNAGITTTEISDTNATGTSVGDETETTSNEVLTLNTQQDESELTPDTQPVDEQVDQAPESETTETPVEEIADEVPAEPVAEEAPGVSQDPNFELGLNLAPFDPLNSGRLESAFSVLRSDANLAPEAYANAQVTVYNVLTHYFQHRDYDEVNGLITNLLKYIETNLGVHFTPFTAFKGFERLTSLNQAQAMEFRMLLKVLIDLAPESSRAKVVKDLNWESVFSQWHPDRAEKMISFFQRFLNLK